MRACGLPFRYARVIPVTHPFRKERENDGAPAPMSWKKSQVMRSRKGRATRQGR